MTTPAPTLLFLPGLAADHRLFSPQLAAFPGSRVLPWITPHRAESLESYAARLAQTIDPRSGPYALVGFSFGSQVAQELVQHLTPRPLCLVLICGVRGTHQYTPAFIRQERLGRLVPGALARMLYPAFAARFARRCALGPEHTRTLVDMARAIDPAFFRWSARACIQWRASPKIDVPLHHIHGQLDDVIPDVRHEATLTIPGAHHLITWTHAQHVNDAIRRAIS